MRAALGGGARIGAGLTIWKKGIGACGILSHSMMGEARSGTNLGVSRNLAAPRANWQSWQRTSSGVSSEPM
jgi:hypothetical protein